MREMIVSPPNPAASWFFAHSEAQFRLAAQLIDIV